LTAGLRSLGRLWRFDRGLLLAYGLAALFLLGFVVAPLVRVALEPSAADWRQVLTTPRWQRAALNTLVTVGLSTTSSLLLGTAFAFAVTRARVPGARLFSVVPLFLLLTPPFVSGLAFVLLLGRRGLLTYHLLGLETSVYGLHGVWLAQTLSFFPVAYLVLRGAFLAVDPTLEQAARGLGADRGQVLRSVTLPLVTPALLAAALFIAIGVLGDFGNPMLVGGRFQVLATAVYTQLTGWASFGTSAALGLVLLVPAVALFAAQQAVQAATRQRFATVGGRGAGLPAPAVAGWLRWSLFALCVLVTLFVLASQGAGEVLPQSLMLRADFDWPKPDRRREFLRARMNAQGGIELFRNQASSALNSTVWANGLVDIPAGKAVVRGEIVRFLPYADLLH